MSAQTHTLDSKSCYLDRAKSISFFMEMCELFGRFALNILMVLFLQKTFHFSDEKAFILFSSFGALLYLTPLIFGVIIDKFLTVRFAVTFGSILNVIGSSLLCIHHIFIIYIGIAIIAVGNGLFLPAMLKLVSELFQGTKNRDSGFTLYWVVKNIGAIFASFSLGAIAEGFGFQYAFIANALVMIIGICFFVFSKSIKTHAERSICYNRKNNIIILSIACIIVFIISFILLYRDISGVSLIIANVFIVTYITKLIIKDKIISIHNLKQIIFAFMSMMIFMTCLNQGGMTLTLFIERIVNRHFLGIELAPPVFYGLEPVFLIIVGPILSIIYKKLSKKNKEPSSLMKNSIGLVILAVGFSIFLIASLQAYHSSQTVSLFYIVWGYAIFPIGELLVSPISISILDKNAPFSAKGFVFSIFAISQANASYLSGILSRIGEINFKVTNASSFSKASGIYSHLFIITIIILVVSGVLAGIIALILKEKSIKANLI